MSENAHCRADDLRKFFRAALQAGEVPPLDAEEASESLVAADLHGMDSQASPAAAGPSPVLAPGELVGQNEARNPPFGMLLGPGVVGQLAENLCLTIPNAADTTDFAETPA